MEIVTFESADCLMKYFRKVGAKVGGRIGPHKRTQDEKELFNLRQYLRTLAANDLLEFPLTVEKRESPDFLLTNSEPKTWGLEVTEATTQAWQRELTVTEGDTTSLRPLGRDGWRGNSAERETCAAILRAMHKKARKIRGYGLTSQCDLLIYVNVRAFFYDIDEVVDLLGERVSRWHPQWAALGCVSVVTKRYLLINVTNHLNRLPLFGLAEDM